MLATPQPLQVLLAALSVRFWQGAVLFVNGAIAMAESCCCSDDDDECPPVPCTRSVSPSDCPPDGHPDAVRVEVSGVDLCPGASCVQGRHSGVYYDVSALHDVANGVWNVDQPGIQPASGADTDHQWQIWRQVDGPLRRWSNSTCSGTPDWQGDPVTLWIHVLKESPGTSRLLIYAADNAWLDAVVLFSATWPDGCCIHGDGIPNERVCGEPMSAAHNGTADLEPTCPED